VRGAVVTEIRVRIDLQQEVNFLFAFAVQLPLWLQILEQPEAMHIMEMKMKT
jgi:hypothetical protein